MHITLNADAELIIKLLNDSGFKAYAVGGCIRDALMGREVTDYDITTSATPDEVKNVFNSHTVIETGIKHGTVTLLLGHIPYEITTYRTENGYSDSRHPDTVSFVGDLNEDLARRDFTMNAVAFSPCDGLVDLFGGIADINSKLIRAVGDPFTRFSEDALRILRALRFASTLGFNIEPKTEKAIFSLANTISKVSPERIYAELKKLICGVNAGNVIVKYRNALSEILPVNSDVSALEILPNDFSMRLTYLCGSSALDVLNNLRADNAAKQKCKLLLNSSPIPTDIIALKFYISALGRENASFVTEYRQSLYNEDMQRRSNKIIASDTCLTLQELAVNGSDLLQLGIKGQAVGETLNNLLTSVISEEIDNKKEPLMQKAKSSKIIIE